MRRGWVVVAASAGVVGALVVVLLATRHSRAPISARIAPTAAPSGWRSAAIASGGATLFYPPGWKPVAGDAGTVSYALRGATGLFDGYLNVTPRQGDERLDGWAAFRISRNRGEGDHEVRQLAAAEDLLLAGARGSCVVDDYVSRVASHHYRELACILAGPRFSNVFVGATLRSEWKALGPVIERAASSLVER